MGKVLTKLTLVLAAILLLDNVVLLNKSQLSASIAKNQLIVNDVTGLNPIPVAMVIKPKTELEITDAIMATSGPISIGGARFSMGGQIAYPNSLHLDMREYNQIIHLDPANKEITVQPGITWREIQQAIDPHDLSVKIMQDFNNFTVGGSLSVNAHGRFTRAGPIINSVKSLRIALANGRVYQASRTDNPQLFRAAIGGYGGIGVITEATLSLTDNVVIERSTRSMHFVDYLDYFKTKVLGDPTIVLNNALLYPPTFEDVLDINWRTTNKPLTNNQRLKTYNPDIRWKPMLVDMVSRFDLLKRLRHNLIDPALFNKPAVVTRNFETSYDLREFGFVSDADSTMALREYFVPLDSFEVFVMKMRQVFIRHNVNVLNVSIRYSPRDRESLLAWARDDMLSFVIIYRQRKDEDSLQRVSTWSRELIDSAVGTGGSYYLPFQKHASRESFFRSYPRAGEYFAFKKRVDPDNRFNNMLLDQYQPDADATADPSPTAAPGSNIGWRPYAYPGVPYYAHPAYQVTGWRPVPMQPRRP